MSITQYTAIISELYAAIVLRLPYQQVASLVLRGSTHNFDLHRVLDDARALALEVAKQSGKNTDETFDSGMLLFRLAFSSAGASLYKELGFEAYFAKESKSA